VAELYVTANVKRVPMGAGGLQRQSPLSEVCGFDPEAKSYLALGHPKDEQNLSLLYTLQTGEYAPKGSRYVDVFQFSGLLKVTGTDTNQSVRT